MGSGIMRVLRTERLDLRWFSADDAASVVELVTDPGWIEHIHANGPRTLDAARAWIESRLVASYLEHGYGLWAVERRDDGAFLGMCGLVRRASLPDTDVGYALLPAARGHGYAREAAAACLAYARDVLGLPRLLAITSPKNVASIRLLGALGMEHERTEVLAGETRESAVFRTILRRDDRPEAAASGVRAEEAIDAIAARFFAAFDNRVGVDSKVAALPALFLPGALVSVAGVDGVVTTNVRDFLVPRAALLAGGRLRDFSEGETEARTDVFGRIAQRWSRYQKRGVLDGAPFHGGGVKTMQLVETARGWKIAALAWHDEPPLGER